MNIVAIIVTYNAMRRQWIDHCLQSLQASSVPITAVVVDNGSTDGTREHVPQRYPDAVWLPQDCNKGFGQANNIGLKYALKVNADYVLLLNQDATIAPDSIQKMLDASDGKSLLSPLHLNGDGSQLDNMFRRSSISKMGADFFDDFLLSKKQRPSYEAGEICAACWFMPISLIREVGGFNPLFFHYGEDNNYYQRLVYHKRKVLLVPQATMRHDRLVHGNASAFNHKALRRDLLIIFCNVNDSFAQCLVQLARLLSRLYTQQLPKKEYVPGRFLVESFWLIGHIPAIRKSRKTDKSTGTSWL